MGIFGTVLNFMQLEQGDEIGIDKELFDILRDDLRNLLIHTSVLKGYHNKISYRLTLDKEVNDTVKEFVIFYK